MSLNPTLRRQVNLCDFKASLVYTMSPGQPELCSKTCLKNQDKPKSSNRLKGLIIH